MNATLKTLLVSTAFAALSFVALPHGAFAQPGPIRDAGSKIRGDAYWPGRAAARHFESARHYAEDVQTYLAKAPQPEPSVVKDIKTELGHYLDEGKKHLVTMKKDFASDKETVSAIEAIEKELAAAIDHNKAMIECCEREKFEKIAAMDCCTDLVKQLDKVHKDHVALMQKLTKKYAAPSPKK